MKTLRYRLHTHLGRWHWLGFTLYKLFGLHRGRLATPATDLVIEGFPRSGTTYFAYAFHAAQPAPMHIVFHVHSPTAVQHAIRLRVPTLVVIRRPEDAVHSAKLRLPEIPTVVFFERYRVFYETLEPHLAHVVVADFNEVVGDVAGVTERLNAKFGTAFRLFDPTPKNIAAVNRELDSRNAPLGGGPLTSYRPNPVKAALKGTLDLTDCAAMLNRCKAVYARLSLRGED